MRRPLVDSATFTNTNRRAVSWYMGKNEFIHDNLDNINIVYIFVVYILYMKTLSLKLEDDIFQETEDVLSKVKKSRNRYINEAVDYYNRINKRNLITKKLAKESKLVKKESLLVLTEFESLHDED